MAPHSCSYAVSELKGADMARSVTVRDSVMYQALVRDVSYYLLPIVAIFCVNNKAVAIVLFLCVNFVEVVAVSHEVQ
jgi:hypothetical protein